MADKITDEEAREMLQYIDPDDRDTWIRVGMACEAGGVSFRVWDQWSKGSSKYKTGECSMKWTGFSSDGGVGIGSLIQMAEDAGYKPPQKKSDPDAWVDYVQNKTHAKLVDRYDYVDLDGKYHHTKLRLREMGGEKTFEQGWLRDNRWTFSGKEHPLHTKGTVFCRSVSGIKKSIDAGEKIFVCEGEKDVLTLQKKGFPALTSGAADSWSDEINPLLDGADVVVLADNDGPGKRSAKKIRKSLEGHAKTVKIIIPSDQAHGDITDYFEAGGTIDDFQQLADGPGDELEDDIQASDQEDQKNTAVLDDGVFRQINDEVPKLETVNAIDLSQAVLDPVQFAVEGLIPHGLSILAAPPKGKKSFAGLDACISVASGTPFLDHETNQSGVLYLALEDSPNRLQQRMDKVQDGRKVSGDLTFAMECATLADGLLDQLDDFCKTHPGTGLICIDTFQKIRGPGSRSESAYASDYREAGALKKFADEHDLAILLIHHTRKMKDATDDFMNISGTLGISGACDAVMVLTKDPENSDQAKLSVTGRDIETEDFQLEFQSSNCRWKIIGTTEEYEAQRQRDEYERNPIVRTVKKLLDQCGGEWTGNATELISASRHYNSPIHEDPKSIGRAIDKLSDSLWFNDRINYSKMPNGSGAKKHRFWLQDNPYLQ